jgi:hypothetical protein
MPNIQEQVVVEAITQYGIKANGKFLNLSPNLRNSGVKPTNFNVGETYLVEIYTGPKGGKSINSYAAVTPTLVPVTVISPVMLPPPPPSLPRTSLPATPAPGGEIAVVPAGYRKDIVSGELVKRGPVADTEKMTKADWAAKDRSIELQAILKSTLESPMLAQLVVGKNNRDALITLTEVFEHSLSLYEFARNK